VGERTVYRRLSEPAFAAQVAEASRALRTQALTALGAASTAAVRTLGTLLNAQSESVRLGACRAILELGTKLRETDELEQRLLLVEERVAASSDQARRA
jgi:hypothetical protein